MSAEMTRTWIELAPGVRRKTVAVGEKMMQVVVWFAKGAKVPQHAHVHEQITYVLDGYLRLTVGEDAATSHDLRAGEVIHLPSNLPHGALALEDTRVLDVFSPPREDWINRTDDYLRR